MVKQVTHVTKKKRKEIALKRTIYKYSCMILGSIHCAIMYAIQLILDVDQKDRSLWERNCYCLRNRPFSSLFYLILPWEGFFLARDEQ